MSFLILFVAIAVAVFLLYDRTVRNRAPKDAPYLEWPRSWLTGMPASYGEYVDHGYRKVRGDLRQLMLRKRGERGLCQANCRLLLRIQMPCSQCRQTRVR
jgi:hypothetical protein